MSVSAAFWLYLLVKSQLFVIGNQLVSVSSQEAVNQEQHLEINQRLVGSLTSVIGGWLNRAEGVSEMGRISIVEGTS